MANRKSTELFVHFTGRQESNNCTENEEFITNATIWKNKVKFHKYSKNSHEIFLNNQPF